MKTLLMVANVDWFFISHRLCIAKEAVQHGWNVIVAAEDTGRKDEITAHGIQFVDFKFSRSGTNPVSEIVTVANFIKLYKKVKPDVVHHITLKPIIYGSLAAKACKIKGVVNAVSGLGYNFSGSAKKINLVPKVMTRLMKLGFDNTHGVVIFQNSDDEAELTNLGVVNEETNIVRLKGSGVDLNDFSVEDFPDFKTIKILFPTRMVWEKGVAELKEASEILKKDYQHNIQFVLAGLADEENKSGVSKEYLTNWSDGTYVKWIGYQPKMAPVYQNSHIVILPSYYREGMPKTLLEACASGRPIITTNSIGCKECVDDNENGIMIAPKSASAIVNAIKQLVDHPEKIVEMGKNSRVKAEREFDVDHVIAKHMEIYNSF